MVLVSLSQVSIAATNDYDDLQIGKIEAAMNNEIVESPKKAKDVVGQIILAQENIDLKYGQNENFSEGRLKAVGLLITEAEELKTQIDAIVSNDELSLDTKYTQVNSALKKLRLLLKQANLYLTN